MNSTLRNLVFWMVLVVIGALVWHLSTTLQKQPAQRDRPHDAQLRRFFGSGSGRKIRYARLLVEALDLDNVPRPLDGVLAHV